MSKKIFITFTSIDGLSSQELEWDLLQNSLAKKWFAEMAIAIQSQSKKIEQNFWGFKLEKADRVQLAEKINSAISKINAHFGNKYQIKETAAAHMDQELLNKLHHHFEILVGQSWIAI